MLTSGPSLPEPAFQATIEPENLPTLPLHRANIAAWLGFGVGCPFACLALAAAAVLRGEGAQLVGCALGLLLCVGGFGISLFLNTAEGPTRRRQRVVAGLRRRDELDQEAWTKLRTRAWLTEEGVYCGDGSFHAWNAFAGGVIEHAGRSVARIRLRFRDRFDLPGVAGEAVGLWAYLSGLGMLAWSAARSWRLGHFDASLAAISLTVMFGGPLVVFLRSASAWRRRRAREGQRRHEIVLRVHSPLVALNNVADLVARNVPPACMQQTETWHESTGAPD